MAPLSQANKLPNPSVRDHSLSFRIYILQTVYLATCSYIPALLNMHL